MKARESFANNIDRCRVLIDLHKKNWPRRPAREGDDLLRAIIVLAISSLDSYMHDIVLENAPRIALAFADGKCNPPGKLIQALGSGLSAENALRLIGRKRPDEALRKMVADHIRERTFQSPNELEGALKLISIDDVWEPLRIKLKLKTKVQAKEFLIDSINRRHKIVHEADLYKGKKHHGKTRAITRPMAAECVRKTAHFVNCLDKIISEHVDNLTGNTNAPRKK